MAKIYSNEGLILNNANNSTAYMRHYAGGKNDVGPLIRFTIASGNPAVTFQMKITTAFSQTNGSVDFNSAHMRFIVFSIDTSGNGVTIWNYSWTSGASIGGDILFTTRQADFYVVSQNNGGFPGAVSYSAWIYCNRWDYVTLSQP